MRFIDKRGKIFAVDNSKSAVCNVHDPWGTYINQYQVPAKMWKAN